MRTRNGLTMEVSEGAVKPTGKAPTATYTKNGYCSSCFNHSPFTYRNAVQNTGSPGLRKSNAKYAVSRKVTMSITGQFKGGHDSANSHFHGGTEKVM